MDIENFIKYAVDQINNARAITSNDDNESAKILYYDLLESIIEFGMLVTGYERTEITKIVENIVSQPEESDSDDHILFFVSEEYLNIETVQIIDNELGMDDSAMVCSLDTGEIKAQCDGHHIWKLSF